MGLEKYLKMEKNIWPRSQASKKGRTTRRAKAWSREQQIGLGVVLLVVLTVLLLSYWQQHGFSFPHYRSSGAASSSTLTAPATSQHRTAQIEVFLDELEKSALKYKKVVRAEAARILYYRPDYLEQMRTGLVAWQDFQKVWHSWSSRRNVALRTSKIRGLEVFFRNYAFYFNTDTETLSGRKISGYLFDPYKPYVPKLTPAEQEMIQRYLRY